MSVNRKAHTSGEKIRRHADQAILRSHESHKRAKTGYLLAVARHGHVKKLKSPDGTGLLCVYDTATADNPAHADIVYAKIHEKISRSVKQMVSDALSSCFSIVEPSDIFPDQTYHMP